MIQKKLKKPNESELVKLLNHSDVSIREKAAEFLAKSLLLESTPLVEPENMGMGPEKDNLNRLPVYTNSFYNNLAEQTIYLNQPACWERFFAIIDKTFVYRKISGNILSILFKIAGKACSEQADKALARIEKVNNIGDDFQALADIYLLAADCPKLYPVLSSLLFRLPKRDLAEYLAVGLLSIAKNIGEDNDDYQILLLEFLANCPNKSNRTDLFGILGAAAAYGQCETFFKSALDNLDRKNVSRNLIEAVLQFIQLYQDELSVSLRIDTLLWLLQTANPDEDLLGDCLRELCRLINFDGSRIQSAVPIFKNLAICPCRSNNVAAVMNGVHLLRKFADEAAFPQDFALCKELLNAIMVESALKNFSDLQVKVILHTLLELQKSKDLSLKRSAEKAMRFFLKHYNFYENPLSPFAWAKDIGKDNIWDKVVKYVPMLRYPRPSEIVEGILYLMKKKDSDDKAKERLYIFLKKYLEKGVTLGYEDYRKVHASLKDYGLLDTITPRMSRSGKEKQKILLSLEF